MLYSNFENIIAQNQDIFCPSCNNTLHNKQPRQRNNDYLNIDHNCLDCNLDIRFYIETKNTNNDFTISYLDITIFNYYLLNNERYINTCRLYCSGSYKPTTTIETYTVGKDADFYIKSQTNQIDLPNLQNINLQNYVNNLYIILVDFTQNQHLF